MMARACWRGWAKAVLAMLLAVFAASAWADTPVALLQSYSGNVNFTGTVATQRSSGTNVCSVYSSTTTLTKALSGIPSGATVTAAYLYWAGSGSTPDTTVTFQGTTINAARSYTGSYSDGTNIYWYFGGAADVTTIVKNKGNGNYTFSGLSVSTGSPYCAVEGVLGGFALMVIYTDPTQPFRVLNVYEGFQFTRNSSIPLNLSNFKVPTPLGTSTGRIGHITWEGDQSLNQQGENLTFNNTSLTDSLNPSGNQFNSKSNINGDQASYGIDFDAYTIGDPIIKAGDTSATTTYASGQDLVWLNVEVVAVPNIPTSDLALTLTRTGDPSPGAVLTYTLNVKNNGPFQDPGPITVTNTLPNGMSYTGATGTGWSCSTNAATGTCIYTGTLAVGESLPPITLGVVVDTSGTYTTFIDNATVDVGQNVFDNVPTNNTVSDTSTDDTMVGADYVFTEGACVLDTVIGSAASNCKRFVGPLLAASNQSLYITAVQSGRTVQPKKTSPKMRFSLTCVNPVAAQGKVATFAGQTLKTCTTNGNVPNSGTSTAWTAQVTITFPSGSPSGRMNTSGNPAPVFNYPDVGLIQLNLVDDDNKGSLTGLARFVSVPKITFSLIANASGGNNPSPTNDGSKAFAKAGELFNIGIKVADNNGAFPPNFGHEAGPYGPVSVTVGAPDPTRIAPTALVFSGPSSGVYSAQMSYSNLGVVGLTATTVGLNGQAQGTYFGQTIAGTSSDYRVVGYFYPAYFSTTATGPMTCLARMNCPDFSLGAGAPATAAYSAEPFKVDVQAFNVAGTDVTSQVTALPSFTVTLDSYSAPGPGGSVIGTAENKTLTPSAGLPNAPNPLTTSAVDVLRTPLYQSSAPRSLAWPSPTPVYMHASASFARLGTSGETITSKNDKGLEIVAGRLFVANATGSEMLRMPLHLWSQYWTGSSWDNNPNDSESTVTNASNNFVSFSTCTRKVNGSGISGSCSPFSVVSKSDLQVNGGQATSWLNAPGAGNAGSAYVSYPGAPRWLPSTQGVAAFGTTKSPVIYLREVY